MKKENAGNRGPGVSGSRRTRSQIAPDWTAADCLVLVNVIAAVEADCFKALSTYQKWKIVAENCSSLDVVRTSNQCRRKWDCLLIEHDVIKQWELKMPEDDSYWCLESGRRKELGLPDNFDEELFKAIDNVSSMRANQSDTEPDSDPEAAVENNDEIEDPGPKRQRRRSMSKSNQALEKSLECERNQALEKSLKSKKVDGGGEGDEEEEEEDEDDDDKEEEEEEEEEEDDDEEEEEEDEGEEEEDEEEEPLSRSPEKEPRECYIKSNVSKVMDSIDPKEQMIAKFLLENAEKVQAIVSENAEYATSDEKNDKDQTNLVRHQGSKLIRCLGDILNTINDLRGLLEDCE